MTAGDFDGDGKDEIYFATVSRIDNPIIPQYGLAHSILRADQDLKLTRIYYQLDTPAEIIVPGQLRAQSGLFRFDPSNGWSLNRRQVVTCFIGGDPFYDGRGPNNQIWCEFRIAFPPTPPGGFNRGLDNRALGWRLLEGHDVLHRHGPGGGELHRAWII